MPLQKLVATSNAKPAVNANGVEQPNKVAHRARETSCSFGRYQASYCICALVELTTRSLSAFSINLRPGVMPTITTRAIGFTNSKGA